MKPRNVLFLALLLSAVLVAAIEYGDRHFGMKSRAQSSLESK